MNRYQVAKLHQEWANRIANEAKTARAQDRAALESEIKRLTVALPTLWARRNESDFRMALYTKASQAFLAAESTLADMSDEPQDMPEDFLPRATWDEKPRLSGDSDTLEREAAEATAEYHRLQAEIDRSRKTLANRCELSKLGMIPGFSWSQAWNDWKAYARETGAEARKERQWARDCERELALRAYEEGQAERAEEFGPQGLSEFYVSDWSEDATAHSLPSEVPHWTPADYAEMAGVN